MDEPFAVDIADKICSSKSCSLVTIDLGWNLALCVPEITSLTTMLADFVVDTGKQNIPDSYILLGCIKAGYVDIVRVIKKVY
jgi:hypothetical protein